ncbi:hypothetical protein D9758_004544 [Tetrapyrgos nigripes]|uniref:Uncharacterized protein n=1 Tax=Tetrapyrgos nigripes TaxID=182062 RepID=A0A8H5LYT4_9AGAR|nr:hypothetical protein D9758_004544 [Tetrapyrgos nigripes]
MSQFPALDAEEESLNCGSGGGADTYFSLRVGSIFIIGIGSTLGALLPVLARRSTWVKVPKSLFDFAKYFGSGVIIATAFIHLLSPALEALESECLSEGWHDYPYALALCMLSIFLIFILEFMTFRWGTSKLSRAGTQYDAHGHAQAISSHASHGPEGAVTETRKTVDWDEESHRPPTRALDLAWAQVIGVAVLEFGVILHSVLIGLTLAVDEDFIVLFVVVVFHRVGLLPDWIRVGFGCIRSDDSPQRHQSASPDRIRISVG